MYILISQKKKQSNGVSPKMLDFAWGATASAKANSSSIINTTGSGAFGYCLFFHIGLLQSLFCKRAQYKRLYPAKET